MQPPIAGQTVLGWDPAFRTGCKLAVVDSTGKVLDTVVIYPTAPQNKVEESKKILKRLIQKYGVTLISVARQLGQRFVKLIIHFIDGFRLLILRRRYHTSFFHCKFPDSEPLATLILLQRTQKPIEEDANAFLNEEKESNTQIMQFDLMASMMCAASIAFFSAPSISIFVRC